MQTNTARRVLLVETLDPDILRKIGNSQDVVVHIGDEGEVPAGFPVIVTSNRRDKPTANTWKLDEEKVRAVIARICNGRVLKSMPNLPRIAWGVDGIVLSYGRPGEEPTPIFEAIAYVSVLADDGLESALCLPANHDEARKFSVLQQVLSSLNNGFKVDVDPKLAGLVAAAK